jgi:tetratricopeptide (TPR) repeat protein
VKLQSDYSQAVLWSKGWGADETKAAFERAGDIAVRAERPTERFPALYGQALWNLVRGEIYAGQDVAERFLREATAEGGVAEVGVAHRVLGLACILSGDLAGARSNLQLALDGYAEGGDSEIRQKFGQDTGVVSRSFLAWALWLSGDLQRARQQIEEATQLANDLAHIPSAMTTFFVKLLMYCFRNDAKCVAVEAEVLAKTSREHGLRTYIAYSDWLLGWAEGRLDDARLGAQELGKSLAEYGSQGNRLFTPLFQGYLAGLEAAAGEAERALRTIGEGLATAQDGGQHVWDAFLHRMRGEILLKGASTNPAPAEEAFLSAIVVAREQGARSPGLQASLALAKLYQSTGRRADAHAALSPALEGFSPTPEMPEIAEALDLLAALEAGAHL